jgi:uncharacterized protein YbaP (TraB family)
MHEDTSDFDRSTSKSDWYLILATELKLWSIYLFVYMQTGESDTLSANKKRLDKYIYLSSVEEYTILIYYNCVT